MYCPKSFERQYKFSFQNSEQDFEFLAVKFTIKTNFLSDCCTFSKTGKHMIEQKLYYCDTCNMNDDEFCICEPCIMNCHKDHVVFQANTYEEGNWLGFCDCGSQGIRSCKMLKGRY